MWQLPATTLKIAPGETHLWCVLCVPALLDLESYHSRLTTEEMARAGRLATATLQRRYLQAHSLLHTLLIAYTQAESPSMMLSRCELAYHTNGKPFLRAPQLHPPLTFNMSHAGEAVVIALARGHEVGVDVEMVRPLDDLGGLIQATCSKREQRHLATLEDKARLVEFYRLWTRKEAWLKLRGIGLGDALPEVLAQPQGVTLLDIPLADRLGGEYVGAVAWLDLGHATILKQYDAVWQSD